ncbi:unnamed protein product [Polarella glacialis]|uniref:Protein kinase domain-containing protein n=1 Tax=Polarella glacialis TaxID=89957 RepID=A0A813K7S3_POLGL|nr:unnamed protein product [Polarella glacialis]CAE8699490.1 unnamed protein product [Polarella glacialis]
MKTTSVTLKMAMRQIVTSTVTLVQHPGTLKMEDGHENMQFDRSFELQPCDHLGEGAHSQVFSDVDGDLAVKVFNKKNADSLHEAKMLAKVTGSDHVVRMYGLFVATGFCSGVPSDVLLMEKCGTSFRDELEQTGPASEHRSGEVLKGLLAALEHIHSHGILHRDVKPDNILFALADRRRAQLSDFGLAACTSDENIKWTCGTPGYVAPELLSGKAGSDRIDVFAAGIVLYIALTMQHPFNIGKEWKIDVVNAEVNVDRLSGCLPDGGFRCCLLVQLLLQKDPDRRPSAKVARNNFWFRRLSVPESCLLPSVEMPAPQPRTASAPARSSIVGSHEPAPAPRSFTSKLLGALQNARRLVRLPDVFPISFWHFGLQSSQALDENSADELWPELQVSEGEYRQMCPELPGSCADPLGVDEHANNLDETLEILAFTSY